MLTKDISLEKVLSLRKRPFLYKNTGRPKLSMLILRNKMLLID